MIQPLPRWLYMMAKPTPMPLADIISMPRYGGRPAELAHVTLLPFADLNERPESFVPHLVERMRGFDEEAFHLCFDRIEERRCVTLRSRRRHRKARRFQGELVRFLTERGFTTFQKAPEVHLTINYQRDGRGSEAIPPLAWCVDEVLLIESVYGKSRHIVHARWPLRSLLL
jgi:RNA 2',3'-cyclic 3'-phosphodiesterase